MDATDTGRLIYLVVLLCGVGAMFFAGQRRDLGKMAKYGLVWAGVFLAILALVQLLNGAFGG